MKIPALAIAYVSTTSRHSQQPRASGSEEEPGLEWCALGDPTSHRGPEVEEVLGGVAVLGRFVGRWLFDVDRGHHQVAVWSPTPAECQAGHYHQNPQPKPNQQNDQ